MTAQLHLFRDHPVPLDIIMQRIVVLGTSGAGKTSGQRSMAERVWRDHKLRFGVFDLAEDWWGLKSSADGNSPGIPVVIFGGDHADLPLPTTGTEFARIVAKLEQPWIADLKALEKPKRLRFIGEANLELLRINKGNPVVIFYDECDSYAPETAKSKEAFFSADATEEVFKRGRKQGIFPIALTQRNAAISKDVVDLCQVALLYRAPGVIDQKVAVGYLGNTVGKKAADAILVELESLPDGECFLVSKAPKMTMMLRVKVLQPTTFDSSATPSLGQRRREPKVLAQPDLEKIRTQMAKDIEDAKADDPAVLRLTIAHLRRDLAERPRISEPVPVTERVEVAVVKPEQLAEAKRIVERGYELKDRLVEEMHATMESERDVIEKTLTEYVGDMGAMLGPLAAVLALVVKDDTHRARMRVNGSPQPVGGIARGRVVMNGKDVTRKVASVKPMTEGITGPMQRVLDTMQTLYVLGIDTPSRVQVGIWLGVKSTSGSFKNYLGALKTAGLIEYVGAGDKGSLLLTDNGHVAANEMPVPSQSELMQRVLGIFKITTQQAILRVIMDAYPDVVSRAELAERIPNPVSHTSGSFKNYLGAMRSAGIIEYVTGGDDGTVRASPVLFLETVNA